MNEQTFILPWPPSTNRLWRAWRGRNIKSVRYREWEEEAGKALIIQRPKPVKGPVRIMIGLCAPTKATWDGDNFVKPVLDLLVNHMLIEDDNKHIIKECTWHVDPPGVIGAQVTITKVAA